MCRDMSPVLAEATVLKAQACFRPVTRDGLPLIGRIAGVENAYVATGHSVWGMLNAPATGEAMAELIADGRARSTDLSPFDPARLRPLDPRQLAASGRVDNHSSRRRPGSTHSTARIRERVGPGLRRDDDLTGGGQTGFIGGRRSAGSRPSSWRAMLWRQKSAGGGCRAAMAPSRNNCSRREPLKMPCAPPRVSAVRVICAVASPMLEHGARPASAHRGVGDVLLGGAAPPATSTSAASTAGRDDPRGGIEGGLRGGMLGNNVLGSGFKLNM